MKIKLLSAAIGAAVFALGASAASATTLEDVKAKGFVQCGVNTGLTGFAAPDASGNWAGFDVDFCKAVASAVFGDPTKVKYTPTNAKERFTALQSGEIDVSVAQHDVDDQPRYRARLQLPSDHLLRRSGLHGSQEPEREVGSGTVRRRNLRTVRHDDRTQPRRLLQGQQSAVQSGGFRKAEEVNAAYDAGRCDVYTTDQSGLYSLRLTLKNPDEHVILPEIISKEPLGPAVRQGDDQWFDIVSWTFYALINAEEFGITQANVDEMKNSPNPDIKRFLGTETDTKIGTDLGLTNEWAYNVVKGVGNYGEVFERNIGQGSPLKIARGLNALWNKGGIQYAPPVR
jgi:general L-amino acid transport system substrate-binding protein